MRILNFGSLNIDYVYAVDHIVLPGETIASKRLDVFCGGKGLNQSIALAKAGARPYHAGMVGADGGMLLEACRTHGVDASLVREVEERSGNAIIQVGGDGQNSIVLFGGANRANTREYVDAVLSRFEPGDMVLLQNEINLLEYIIDQAAGRGMAVALNPAPYDENLASCAMEKVSVFIMNEVEGRQMTGESEPEAILDAMLGRYPGARVVLTLGGDGVAYRDADASHREGICPVPVVDTTAAGDTFTGYFLAAMMEGLDAGESLRLATRASALAVSRPGAVESIPVRGEVEEYLRKG